jgi:nucleoprotein TPR
MQAADGEAKRALDNKVKDLEGKVRELEERNSLLDLHLQHLDKEKESRLAAAFEAAHSPLKAGAAAAGPAGEGMGEGDNDAEKERRETREYMRRMQHKIDVADCKLEEMELELQRERQRAEQLRREVGDLRARLEVEEVRNASALGSQQDFEKLREQVQTLSVFKESNANLRLQTDEANAKLAQVQRELKEAEAQAMPLRQQVARLETREKVLTSDKAQLLEQLERWKTRASDLKDKFGGAGVDPAEYEKVRGQVEQSKAQAVQAAAAAADANRAKDTALAEANKLRAELKLVQDASKALTKQLEEAKAAAAAAAGAGEKTELTPEEIKASQTYQNMFTKAKDESQKNIERIKTLKQENRRLMEDLKKAKEETDKTDQASGSKDQESAEIVRLNTELQSQTGKLVQATADKDTADAALVAARSDLSRVEQELADEKAAREEQIKAKDVEIKRLVQEQQRAKAEAAKHTAAASKQAKSPAVSAAPAAAAVASVAPAVGSAVPTRAVPAPGPAPAGKAAQAQAGAIGGMAGTKRASVDSSAPGAGASDAAPSAAAAVAHAPQKRGRVATGHSNATGHSLLLILALSTPHALLHSLSWPCLSGTQSPHALC